MAKVVKRPRLPDRCSTAGFQIQRRMLVRRISFQRLKTCRETKDFTTGEEDLIWGVDAVGCGEDVDAADESPRQKLVEACQLTG
jgi:hypothetical protein